MTRSARGFAVLELVICTLVILLLAAILFPVFAQSKGSRRDPCLSNIKQCITASKMYEADYDDRFPDRDHWMDLLYPYAKNEFILHCPRIGSESTGRYGYSFNSWLARHTALRLQSPDEIPQIFDSINLARNASDPFVSFPPPDDHEGGVGRRNVAFVDGHAKYYSPAGGMWRAP
jgi:prepilin-type processing-associated H-X9-DG protein